MAPYMDRKLAAIVAVDVVAYARLVETDEGGTLARVRAHRVSSLEPLVGRHRGRVVKHTGDGALIEFSSAVDAVACSVAIQQAMADRERAEPEERRIRYRIGINIGDIVHEDGDIFGDSVNIAVRLEGLAEPGGICIARDAYNQVRNKLSFGFEPVGEHYVKNIREPVAVYRVSPQGCATSKSANARLRTRPPHRHWHAAAVVVLIAAVLATWYGAADLASPPETDIEADADVVADRTAIGLPAEPSVAVLPFDNFSGNAEMDYFSDGVAADIIIGLSRSPELLVVARSSSFAYKDQAVDVREIARDLGVRYVLEGSVRTSSDKLRITAQLIDAISGHHVWGDSYDNQGTDALALQDEVTTKIINTLVGDLGAIRKAEYQRVWAEAPTALEEYDYLLRGLKFFWRFTEPDMVRARDIWLEGLRKFPHSSLLKIKLGWTYFQEVRYGWSSDPEGDLERSLELVQKGLSYDSLSTLGELYGHWLLADLSVWHARDFESAMVEAEKTLALFPGFPEALASLCRVFLYAGQPDVALMNINEAIRRNPRPPDYYYRYKGWAYFMLNNYGEAIAWLEKMKIYELPAKRLLAASYAHFGLLDEANAAAAELLEHHPDLSVASLRQLLPYRKPEDLERELSGLRKAGLPEGQSS